MLVLTRKVGESIVVGDDIEITVVRIDEEQIRIGIAAPKNVPVYRKELIEEVGQENILAAEAAKKGNTEILKAMKIRLEAGSDKKRTLKAKTKNEKRNVEEKK